MLSARIRNHQDGSHLDYPPATDRSEDGCKIAFSKIMQGARPVALMPACGGILEGNSVFVEKDADKYVIAFSLVGLDLHFANFGSARWKKMWTNEVERIWKFGSPTEPQRYFLIHGRLPCYTICKSECKEYYSIGWFGDPLFLLPLIHPKIACPVLRCYEIISTVTWA